MKKLIAAIICISLFAGCTKETKDNTPSSLKNGLVAYYPFNGNANDESGKDNNGTVNGATLTTDRFGNQGKAYNFNGVNSFIQVPDNATLRPETITLSAWIKTTFSEGVIVGKTNFANAQNEQYNLALGIPYNRPIAMAIKQNGSCIPGNGWNYSISNNDVFDNKWHHIVGTFDGAFMKLYIDGTLVHTTNSLPSMKIDNCIGGDLQIGRWWNDNPLFFNGNIDDIRIYNRALTQEEITYLANN